MKVLLHTILICFFSFQLAAQTETGNASFYHDKFQGGKTASGEIYNKDEFTAAHRTLPFGTIIKVSRIDNGKSVTVRVNDRGPFSKGRVVDLSRAAAIQLGMVDEGLVPVKLRVSSEKVSSSEATSSAAPGKKTASSSATPGKKAATETSATKNTPPGKRAGDVAIPQEAIDISLIESAVKGDFATFDLYKVQVLRMRSSGYGVQVASYSQYENVLKQIAMLQENWFKNVMISVQPGIDGSSVYKVILGPFPDRTTATSYKNSIKEKGMDGFIINLKDIPIQK